jgi:hypothetical protein
MTPPVPDNVRQYFLVMELAETFLIRGLLGVPQPVPSLILCENLLSLSHFERAPRWLGTLSGVLPPALRPHHRRMVWEWAVMRLWTFYLAQKLPLK